MCSHIEEVSHLLIVCKILNKKDLGAAESGLLQCGRVGLLFSWKAGQDSAREVCLYLKLLWAFFQREKEVVYYLWNGKETSQRANMHIYIRPTEHLSESEKTLQDELDDPDTHRQRLPKEESSLYSCIIGQLKHYFDTFWIICRWLWGKTFRLPLLLLFKCLESHISNIATWTELSSWGSFE